MNSYYPKMVVFEIKVIPLFKLKLTRNKIRNFKSAYKAYIKSHTFNILFEMCAVFVHFNQLRKKEV